MEKISIEVLLTGGTIGSAVKGGMISPAGSPAEKLKASYKNAGGKAEFEFVSPYTILSENLNADNINALVSSALGAYKSGYDKIIICHGTDTLQYSAAAVLYALAGAHCSCVFVSAAKPLDAEGTNGFDNFCAAAAFLENTDMPGVYAAYKNGGENAKILPAARLALHAEGGESLNCVNGEYAAEFINGKIIPNPQFVFAESKNIGFPVHFKNFSGVEIITAAPGQEYAPCKSGTRAAILKPYHSGTLNTASADFRKFCQNAKERNIPLFAVDIKPGAQYESSFEFEKLGIIPIEGAAFAATYIKLWLAGGKKGKELEQFIKTSFAGEL